MPDNALVLLPIWDILNGTPLTLCFPGVRPARNIIIVVYTFGVMDFLSFTITILKKLGIPVAVAVISEVLKLTNGILKYPGVVWAMVSIIYSKVPPNFITTDKTLPGG